MGTLVEIKEYVRPVRVSKHCGCLGPILTVPLVLTGMMAGRPARYMYSCPECKQAYYLDEPAVTIQYEVISEVIQQGDRK